MSTITIVPDLTLLAHKDFPTSTRICVRLHGNGLGAYVGLEAHLAFDFKDEIDTSRFEKWLDNRAGHKFRLEVEEGDDGMTRIVHEESGDWLRTGGSRVPCVAGKAKDL